MDIEQDYVLCCRDCRKRVSRLTGPDGSVWFGHPGNQDHHEVEPVLTAPADAISVCDFCLDTHPHWAFPLLDRVSTQMFYARINATVVAEDTDAWWAACTACADLIRDRKIGQLRDRALAVLRDRLPAHVPWDQATWERESVLLQLAAFWRASPGSPVEVSVFAD